MMHSRVPKLSCPELCVAYGTLRAPRALANCRPADSEQATCAMRVASLIPGSTVWPCDRDQKAAKLDLRL